MRDHLTGETERRQLIEHIERFEAEKTERLAALRQRAERQSTPPPGRKEA
jgi:hypothetical protein